MILIQTIYTTKMPFEKGNKLGKGRPAGSKNKSTDVDKMDLQEMLFNIEDMKRDFLTLDAYKKFDVRMKAMSFFYSKPSTEIQIESKPWANQKFILDIGEEDLSEEEKKRLYFEAGGDGTNPVDLPLFLD
tara:strand:+ start:543 stop:932 length:390 start_codon:yes stop_codon:yes gene_type:complete